MPPEICYFALLGRPSLTLTALLNFSLACLRNREQNRLSVTINRIPKAGLELRTSNQIDKMLALDCD